MSGMAGNVTAFNTVWTYDLYQAYIVPNKSDAHYMWMGRVVTVVGILLSIACAYFAKMYDNAMDVIQLVFSFVNAPLFATFVLGMFWSRTTGTGAFWGLLGGIGSSALVHGLTIAEKKGGWMGVSLHEFPFDHGPELLDRHLRLRGLLRPDLRDFPGHSPHEGQRATERARLFADPESQGGGRLVALAAGRAGRDPPCGLRGLELVLLVKLTRILRGIAMLDLRLPMGLMFSLVGVMMIIYNLFTWGHEEYQHSLGINVNFWWGLTLLAFGLIMLGLAKLAAAAEKTGEGQQK